MARIGIVGTTSWGTTLGVITARQGHTPTLWARSAEEAADLERHRENRRFHPGVRFPEGLTVTASADDAFRSCDLAIVAVPTSTVRQNARRLHDALLTSPLILSATKGVEPGTGKRPSEMLAEELGEPGRAAVGAISGPNLAREIIAGKPASATVAFPAQEAALATQAVLTSSVFRVYTTDDIVGLELGGALKNIIAICAGVIDGLGLGDNAKAAIITRGLHEITRLGVVMGARPETFAGLSGLGDLVATCYSKLSRNRFVGEELGKGRSIDDILAGMDQTAEGVPATSAAVQLAARLGVEMPLAETLRRLLFDGLGVQEAVEALMRRAPVPESRIHTFGAAPHLDVPSRDEWQRG
ncbi:MAG: NAD(P)-dependent glycerol-3-phosphate dehydrogenase [Chloroflexi bacterium]|nr:NAD(P)-dependent glycerol-3-phosphate dehydrogenase [Chloroflexota bacterium]